MRREKSVIDVWYDSGAMPFAQWHYPMEHKDLIDKKTLFPADYICEAVDQTRGWFYTLLAVSVLLGYESPYKNVICLGHINDKFGRKMSKSKGNTVDPWDVAGRFGIDAIRWYFYTANPPGEPKNFDEQEVAKAMRRVHMIIYNCAIFWKTYARSAPPGRRPASPHALDRWILARLQEMIAEATVRLECYEIREAGIAIEQFVDDLSRWYIRRSRRRFQKPDSPSDLLDASSTLQTVLAALSKITAPFSPFFAEALYAFVAPDGAESVHLDQWPIAAKVSTRDRAFVGLMREARQICADGLAARASAGIKVRQPLSRATLKSTALRGKEEFLSIIREEINVKAIAFDSESEALVMLDTAITPELAAEGLVRDVSRMVQELRAKAGFEPRDSIELFAIVPDEYRLAMENALAFLKKETGARSIAFKKIAKFAAEEATEVDGREFWLAVRRS
jgi:isoleucyl-tRNA synthetase